MAAPAVENLPKPVPVITSKQRNKILKKTKKKPQRVLLDDPHDAYWPTLLPEEDVRMAKIFERMMEAEKNLDNMKLVEKEMMMLKRKKWSNDLAFGINAVPRGVIKGSVIAVLIADDVKPKHLVQHVITLCGVAAVPVLLVSSLRKYTKELLGFSSIALGIKKIGMESDNKYVHELHETIKEISQNHKPPLSVQQFSSVAREVDSKDVTVISVKEERTVAPKQSEPSTDLYLYRTSRERVFVPESQKVQSDTPEVVSKPKEKEKRTLGDFLSLGDSDSDEFMETDMPLKGISHSMINLPQKPKRKNLTPPFVPLKYKIVKPNPNKKH